MRTRCFNVTHPTYKNYGARGVSVSEEWVDSYDQFLKDMGPKPEGMSLDRIDPNGNYCKENCRWADLLTQNNNRRKHLRFEYKGRIENLTSICRQENVEFLFVRKKVVAGESFQESIEEARSRGRVFFERAAIFGGAGNSARKTTQKRNRRKNQSSIT